MVLSVKLEKIEFKSMSSFATAMQQNGTVTSAAAM